MLLATIAKILSYENIVDRSSLANAFSYASLRARDWCTWLTGTVLATSCASIDGIVQRASQLSSPAIIGLGEPTHGSGNATEWIWALVHRLAEAGRLSAICLESSSASTDATADAVLHGGDVTGTMPKLGRMWATREFEAGLVRLQQLNLARPLEARTTIHGIDFQNPKYAAQRLIEAGHDRPALTTLNREGPHGQLATELLASELQQIVDSADRTHVHIAKQLQKYRHVYLTGSVPSRLHERDRFMADAVSEVASGIGIVVVWAHNEHVAVNPRFESNEPSMGWFLGSRRLDYLSIGSLCGQGLFRGVNLDERAAGWQPTRLTSPAPGSTEEALTQLAPQDCLIDTRSWSHPGPRRFVGWCFQHGEAEASKYRIHRPLSDFNYVRWFSTSTPSEAMELTKADGAVTADSC